MHTIYGLTDPRNGQIRYIGRTANPETRLREHIVASQAGVLRNDWIKELRRAGEIPGMCILETVPESEVAETEKFYIGYFKMLGANLTNFTTRPPRKRKIKTQMMMRIDQDLLERIDERAASEGISRSAWISMVCARHVRQP